jgi:hypothetical protein
MKLFTILLPLFYTCEYVYICAYVYKSLDCSSYVTIRSGFRVSNRVSVICGFGFGHEFSPESVFGSVSGFKFGFRFWVPRHSTRSEPDPFPSLGTQEARFPLVLTPSTGQAAREARPSGTREAREARPPSNSDARRGPSRVGANNPNAGREEHHGRG